MALRMQDVGELAYGGAVTLAQWWDSDRIKKGQLADKDVLKKAGFYTYLVIGLGATLANVFGWWRRGDAWTERLMHGFIFGLPGFVYEMVKTLQTSSVSTHSRADALAQANAILAARQARERAAAGKTNYAVTDPNEILT